MVMIIGIILVVIVVIIIGLILRKRVYDSVDRLEGWKLDVMNRNIGTELARIKTLNLSGETQEKFETWKSRWETIAARDLSRVEDFLFDAEDAADRYRFPSANKALQQGNAILHTIENDLEQMLEELDILLASEQSSRKGVEEITPTLKKLQKTMMQDRYKYGKAHHLFNKRMEKIEEDLAEYRADVEAGEYTKAKQLVDEMSGEMEQLEEEMTLLPELLHMCKEVLPDQIREVSLGIDEMRELGYHIEELGVESEIEQYKEQIATCMDLLDNGVTEEVPTLIEEVEENIKDIYTVLEKEVVAKNYIESQYLTYFATLEQIRNSFSSTKTEFEELRQTYFIENDDMEQFVLLDNTIQQIEAQVATFKKEMEEKVTTHSILRSQIEQGFKQMEQLKEEHATFTEKIQTLRKDELEAKQTLQELWDELYNVQRHIKKSNLPGIPAFILERMDASTEKNEAVVEKLNKQPLDMGAVQHALNEAKQAARQFAEEVEICIDQANLTEHVIQYANRYRSSYPILAAKLKESERLFRKSEYELALEKAAEAIEEIEPGALKQIERYQEEVSV